MQAVAHEVATKELAEHLRPIFESSPDGVYIWLDEEHWICSSYWNRVQTRSFPTTLRFQGVRKDGSEVLVETEMIPLTYGGHTFAYHFVRNVGRPG